MAPDLDIFKPNSSSACYVLLAQGKVKSLKASHNTFIPAEVGFC